MADKTYLQRAKKKWPHAEWIVGNGRFALLAYCDVLTITLWPTYEEAIKSKAFIDKAACGHACYKNHEIIDLITKRQKG